MDAATMIPFLRNLAGDSARVIKPLFASPDLQVEWKQDQSPVTYADRKAEEILRILIAREFPGHGIIGEEFDDTDVNADYTWVLDPIDGTRSFTAGCPLFGTLICLRYRGRPIWGAINLPMLNQLYIGDNTFAICNDHEVKVRETAELKNCFLLTTDPKSPRAERNAHGWDALLTATGQYRSWGDCFGYTLLASGGADIMCDPVMNIWDVAALLPILNGAGAAVSDWHGNDPTTGDSLVAAHPRHHSRIIELLNPHKGDAES